MESQQASTLDRGTVGHRRGADRSGVCGSRNPRRNWRRDPRNCMVGAGVEIWTSTG